MSRRRNTSRHEEESSLELLLDTMCNTFGGVMFIAISLFVITLNMVQNIPVQSTQAAQDPIELQKQIDSLRIMLEQLQEQTRFKQKSLAIQKQSDEQSTLQHELLMARQIVKELGIKKTAVQQAREKLQTPLREIEAQKNQLASEIDQLEMLKRQQQTQQLALQKQLDELKQLRINQLELSFKMIRPSVQEPFFIILHGSRAWPVGPWHTPGGEDHPDDAVSASEVISKNNKVVSCRIKPHAGIEVLSGEKISAEFIALLNKIPSDRIPKFYVHPGSAASTFKLREILKKQNIKHGCTLAVDDKSDFKYQYLHKVDYEY